MLEGLGFNFTLQVFKKGTFQFSSFFCNYPKISREIALQVFMCHLCLAAVRAYTKSEYNSH